MEGHDSNPDVTIVQFAYLQNFHVLTQKSQILAIRIRIYKPTDFGIIVSGIEPIESCLCIVEITTVAKDLSGRTKRPLTMFRFPPCGTLSAACLFLRNTQIPVRYKNDGKSFPSFYFSDHCANETNAIPLLLIYSFIRD